MGGQSACIRQVSLRFIDRHAENAPNREERDGEPVYQGLSITPLPTVIWNSCEQVVLTKAPFSEPPPYVGPEQFLRQYENLLLPLSEDGARVNMILKIISFEIGRSSAAEVRAHRPAIR